MYPVIQHNIDNINTKLNNDSKSLVEIEKQNNILIDKYNIIQSRTQCFSSIKSGDKIGYDIDKRCFYIDTSSMFQQFSRWYNQQNREKTYYYMHDYIYDYISLTNQYINRIKYLNSNDINISQPLYNLYTTIIQHNSILRNTILHLIDIYSVERNELNKKLVADFQNLNELIIKNTIDLTQINHFLNRKSTASNNVDTDTDTDTNSNVNNDSNN